MPAQSHFAESPREVGLDPAKVQALFNRAEREVKDGLLPSAQIAIARNGKIGAMRTVGRAVQGGAEKAATNETLYAIFSCTKAIMSAAIVDSDRRREAERRASASAEIVPEFGTQWKRRDHRRAVPAARRRISQRAVSAGRLGRSQQASRAVFKSGGLNGRSAASSITIRPRASG